MPTTIPSPDPAAAAAAATNSGYAAADPSTLPTYGSASKSTYLGVPNDYTTRQPNPWAPVVWGTRITTPVAPLYKDGDQYRELPTSREDMIALQRSLVSAGYVSSGDAARMVLGSPDPITVAAFRSLLITSNISGNHWQSALASRLADAAANPPEATHRAHTPLVLRPDNPVDIAAAANKAGATLNGTYLTPDEIAQFTKAYQGQENAYSTAAYAATGYDPVSGQYDAGFDPTAVSGTPGEAVKPPTAENAASDLLRSSHPNEVAANDFTANLGTILATLKQNSNRATL